MKESVERKNYYICPWKIGDIYAFRLESKIAEKFNLKGKYILLQKVDEINWYPKHIIPIVNARLIEADKFSVPIKEEQFLMSESIQIAVDSFEESYRISRLLGKFGKYKEELSSEQIAAVTDEFGYLPIYRFAIIITSAKQILDKFFFAGHVDDISKTKNESILNSNMETFNFFPKDVEDILVDRYNKFNLRQAEIYKRPKN